MYLILIFSFLTTVFPALLDDPDSASVSCEIFFSMLKTIELIQNPWLLSAVLEKV